MTIDRSPAARGPGLDRGALMDRLGDVDNPPPPLHSRLTRAAMAGRLPQLVGLDPRYCYRLCVKVVQLIRPRKTP
jgi:hypothetical protein